MANPDTPAAFYAAMAEDWSLISALLSGAEALRNETYLPRHDAESDTAYAARRKRSFLYNGFRKAVRNVTGRIFAKPITLSSDMPEVVVKWCDDVDLRGNSVDRFARQLFARALAYGPGYILVDFTRVPDGVDMATERSIGARPYMVHVPATALIDAETARIGGETIITYARILESRTVRDPESYTTTIYPRVREMTPGSYRLWERGLMGWEVVESGAMAIKGAALDRVPLVPLWLGEMDDDFAVRPPLMDLAHKNLEHFQSASDQRNILTFARFPMLAHAGQIPKETDDDGNVQPLQVGPRIVLQSQDHQSRYYYVEPTGAAISAGREDLKTLKEEMDELGMQPLMDRVSGNIMATVAILGASEAHSVAQAMALAMKDALDTALWLMGLWAGIEDAGGVILNSDFAVDSGRGDTLKSLIDMRAARDLSRRTLWQEMRRKNVLSQEFDAEEEEGRLESEPDISAGMGGAADAGGAGGVADAFSHGSGVAGVTGAAV